MGGEGEERVVEPHTGLPMIVGKYGDGHGGTDSNPVIEGFHQHAQAAHPEVGTGNEAGTNWQAIKKANVPY
jgi:hypothetical protein